MTRSIRIRLIVFTVIAVLGIVYVGASYFGLVDRVLGRNVDVAIDLPSSGGLYVGSSVDYRGVDVGKVTGMSITRSGVHVTLQLDPGTQVPASSKVRVEDLSAVGEQYVDFVPTSDAGPYLADGDSIQGDKSSLPPQTQKLLGDLNDFAGSLNTGDLRTVVSELGTVFRGNAANLRKLIDSSSTFVDKAQANQKQTIDLLDASRKVLATQQAHAGDIRGFAHDLANFTDTLQASDPQLRTILQGGSSTVRELHSLVKSLSPLLPTFIANLVTVNQVFTARLPALEQTLVTFPLMLSNGFIGTPGDGFGHLNMQLTYVTPVCTQGYEPASQWLPGTDTSEPKSLFHVHCTDPRAQPGYTGSSPILQRGVNMVPPVGSIEQYRVAGYNPATGRTKLPGGKTVTMTSGSSGSGSPGAGGLVSLLSSSDWESILVGPVTRGGGQ